jgi:uncharacterized protein (TIGR00251 family)
MRAEMEREALIRVKVTPRSSKNRIAGKEKDFYRVTVTSAPAKGKANNALIELLAEALDVPKREIEIVSGKTGRLKTIRIRGLPAGDITKALEAKSREHRTKSKTAIS